MTMKKVITFALWGNSPTYNVGAIRNAELALNFYPDFECWFYIHRETVPKETVDKLEMLPNTKIIYKTGDLNTIKPMMWRFEAIDDEDVEIMMSRDTDTRILLREKLAVEEWLESRKIFHIMRDHPHHNFLILGGMFGTKKIPNLASWGNLMNNFSQVGNRDYDQHFLRDYIYPMIVNDSMIHCSFHKKEGHAKNFPIDFCNEYKFVGEYVYNDESRSIRHIDVLKRKL